MSKKQRYQNTPERETFIKPLVAKNTAQEFYLNMIKESTITFGVGPAGTGKTFLACHEALSELLSGEYDRIILTRPIVATEDIGFLPGDMNEKINPYLMPLFDAVEDQRVIVVHDRGLAVHKFLGTGHGCAHCLGYRLVTKANTKHRLTGLEG